MDSEGYGDKNDGEDVSQEDDRNARVADTADRLHLAGSGRIDLVLEYRLPPEQLDVLDAG